MVRRTIEMYACDICGNDGKRYQVIFDEGTWVTDRCERHARPLEKIKDEPGEWLATPGRQAFRKSTPAEIRLALARGNSDGK